MKVPGLSIGQRLALSFGALVTALAAVAMAVFGWQRESIEAQARFTNEIAPRVEFGTAAERQTLQAAIDLRSYLLDPSPEALQRFEAEVDAARQETQRLGTLALGPRSTALYATVQRETQEFYRVVLEAARIGDRLAFGTTLEPELVRSREQAVAALRDFTRQQEQLQAEALAEMAAARDRVSRGVTFAVLLSALLLGLLAMYLSRIVRSPVRRLAEVARALEQGDWTPALQLPMTAAPTRDELQLLTRAFGAAAVALEHRERRLTVDRQLANAKASTLDKMRLGELALPIILEHAQGQVGVLYWHEEPTGRLIPVASRALQGPVSELNVGEGVPGQAARDRQPIILNDIPADTPFAIQLGYDRAPPRTVVAVPIIFRDALRGVLVVASVHRFDETTVNFLSSAATQLGIGLHNILAHEQTQRLLDEVTGQNERIQAQNEELQAQNEEIQAQHEEIQAQNDELSRQSDELRHHAQQLALADERKDAFLGVLAHELRNPMAPITNSLHLLQRVAPGSEQARRAQAVIERQTQHMVRLIDDLLDVTRISRGKIQLKREPLDLREVVRSCAQDHETTIGQRRLRLEVDMFDGPVWINGDRVRLCQMVGNLMNNAIKFTDPEGTITLSLRVDGDCAVLSLSDSGVGIDHDLLKTLFIPFTQGASSLARSNGGLGLGLALVKALAEMHGGSVSARSDGLGKGAEFTVQLPLSAAPGPSEVHAPSAPVRARRILLVEDNLDAAQSLAEAMMLEGHQVSVAHSGAEGLEHASRFQPEVVLCDIGLPELDGYEFARRLRRDSRLQSVLLIALTGYASEQDKVRASQAGFDEHLAKPANLDQLNAILARHEIAAGASVATT